MAGEAKQAVKLTEAALQAENTQDILNKLLQSIEPVNFRELAGLEEGEKIKQKHYVISVIDCILSLAARYNWGLCQENDFIFLFNSKYWQVVENAQLKTFLGEAAAKMGVDESTAKYYKFRDELYKQFICIAALPTLQTKDNVLINLQNGTYEINDKKQQLREHRQEDFIKHCLPFSYDPEADCPLFMQFLNRVLPDKSSQLVLAEFMGFIFAKNLKLEKALVLYGSGANGKSVFFDVMMSLLGKHNTCNYSIQSLTDKSGYQRAEMANKLVNYSSENNPNIEATLFKALASGEPVEARVIYGRPFIIENYARLIFNANLLPFNPEQTPAYFRRFLILPFSQTIPPEEQDPNLSRKIIKDELPGVFNWVLRGLDRLLFAKKFTVCKAAETAINQYRTESDSVSMFCEENMYKPDANHWFAMKDIYHEYRTFCFEDGYKPLNRKNFTKRMASNGYITEVKDVGRVVYLRKQSEAENDLPF